MSDSFFAQLGDSICRIVLSITHGSEGAENYNRSLEIRDREAVGKIVRGEGVHDGETKDSLSVQKRAPEKDKDRVTTEENMFDTQRDNLEYVKRQENRWEKAKQRIEMDLSELNREIGNTLLKRRLLAQKMGESQRGRGGGACESGWESSTGTTRIERNIKQSNAALISLLNQRKIKEQEKKGYESALNRSMALKHRINTKITQKTVLDVVQRLNEIDAAIETTAVKDAESMALKHNEQLEKSQCLGEIIDSGFGFALETEEITPDDLDEEFLSGLYEDYCVAPEPPSRRHSDYIAPQDRIPDSYNTRQGYEGGESSDRSRGQDSYLPEERSRSRRRGREYDQRQLQDNGLTFGDFVS